MRLKPGAEVGVWVSNDGRRIALVAGGAAFPAGVPTAPRWDDRAEATAVVRTPPGVRVRIDHVLRAGAFLVSPGQRLQAGGETWRLDAARVLDVMGASACGICRSALPGGEGFVDTGAPPSVRGLPLCAPCAEAFAGEEPPCPSR